ncbi:MAG: helix-turn-helix transcriptional regulator [Phycisphaerae bacterium]|jgi:hypothetical protein
MKRDESSRDSHLLGVFVRNVRAIIKQRHITQVMLAEGIDEPYHTVNNWLTKAATPSAIDALRIAEYLRVSLDDLHARDPETDERLRQIYDYAERISGLAQGGMGAGAKKTRRKSAGSKKKT